ncbi:AAA family ATPase [Cupriavidus sp. AcVe19-1a]|uniref:AAA family ATPase n=1 Tax=Cupriavidus sp. AcVe19-1a TaxID=2821359 RepID=UPI001AE2B853|nr:AAA family ATPase [Cupriavidus sp. AcVe19-1a]MBP0628345.1 AAA family ATPase [Cupriavidus sp. AcVe19-1a]
MTHIYRRPALAGQMAQQLLHPSVLDEGLRSGLFLSGLRRTGKTTFLINDLVPALEAEGAIVIYVDLWSDTQRSPASLILAAVKKTLAELEQPGSAALRQLKRVSGADFGAFGLKFGFKLESIGEPGGATLAQALAEVIDKASTNVVLIVDEVQHAITSEEGNRMLLALKAARDAVNPRPNTPGYFIFVGTGSHRALVADLTARRNQAFAGATSVSYPVLGEDYVAHLLERLSAEEFSARPSLDVAVQAFRALGNRPEEMIKALRQLHFHLPSGSNPDEHLPVIANTLRSTAADLELMKLEQLGGLATAIFDRIACAEGDARGLFSGESAAAYSAALGREVRIEEAQPVVNEMMATNLIMRKGHGVYGVTDPFVQEIWLERKSLEGKL